MSDVQLYQKNGIEFIQFKAKSCNNCKPILVNDDVFKSIIRDESVENGRSYTSYQI